MITYFTDCWENDSKVQGWVLASHHHDVIGRCGFEIGGEGRAEIASAYPSILSVSPEYSNRGIGAELFKQAIQQAQALAERNGIALTQLVSTTRTDNVNILRIFQILGFSQQSLSDSIATFSRQV